jgi:hypothetical protein
MNTSPPRGTADSPTGSSPADAALEISRFGSAVLREVWAPEPLRILRDAIVGFCDHRAERVASGAADPMTCRYHAQGTVTLNWLIFEGRLDLAFLSQMFAGSFYQALCRAYFDDDQLYLSPDRIGSRNMQPPHSALTSLPYHQDSYTEDRRIRGVLNCWIPLDPGAGRTSPGVEVVRAPGRPGFQLKHPAGSPPVSGYDSISIDRDRVVAEYGENFLAPAFEVGDSLVFSQDVIHRTYVTPQMTQPRIGFEFRVFSLKHLAPGISADEMQAEAYPLA